MFDDDQHRAQIHKTHDEQATHRIKINDGIVLILNDGNNVEKIANQKEKRRIIYFYVISLFNVS